MSEVLELLLPVEAQVDVADVLELLVVEVEDGGTCTSHPHGIFPLRGICKVRLLYPGLDIYP